LPKSEGVSPENGRPATSRPSHGRAAAGLCVGLTNPAFFQCDVPYDLSASESPRICPEKPTTYARGEGQRELCERGEGTHEPPGMSLATLA
jgi:hypothetical protein